MSRASTTPPVSQRGTVSLRTFAHKAMMVEEIIMEWGEGRRKLIWSKGRFTTLDVTNGTPNVLVHDDYLTTDPDGEARARASVQTAFDKHWGLAEESDVKT